MWSWKNAGAAVASAPALIGLDEFRLAIPWRDALQQGPPPLHQPGAVCGKLSSPVEPFAANGKLSLNCLSHPRGQAHLLPADIQEVQAFGPVTSFRRNRGPYCSATILAFTLTK